MPANGRDISSSIRPIDHLVLDFLDDDAKPSADARRRSEITLHNAGKFLPASRMLGQRFTPVGVIQGWSSRSMANAAKDLVGMGYSYLAVGGMVLLRIDQIERALSAIRDALPKRVKLHLLGFGKTEHLGSVRRYGVASFDTTSPLLRAFKDGKRNYYSLTEDGELDYYTAVRIPQAIDNSKLLRRAKRGRLDQENLIELETRALESVRRFASRKMRLADAIDAVIDYGRYALWDETASEAWNESRLAELRQAYSRTLGERPWEACACRVCREAGVEVLIFRSSNRNKRRGMHNLHVFYAHLQKCGRERRTGAS